MADSSALYLLAAAAEMHSKPLQGSRREPKVYPRGPFPLKHQHPATDAWNRLNILAEAASAAHPHGVPALLGHSQEQEEHLHRLSSPPVGSADQITSTLESASPRALPVVSSEGEGPRGYEPRHGRVAGKPPGKGFSFVDVTRGWRACTRCRKRMCLRFFRPGIRTCLRCESQKRDKAAGLGHPEVQQGAG